MPEQRQQDLIPIEATLGAAPVVAEHESAGRYTAARLRSQKPELARAALALLGAGYGLQDTADALNLHFYSVQALAAESPETVAVGKKMTARLAGNVGRTALQKIDDFLKTCTVTTAQQAQQLATVAGIALDKAQVLDGEPSEIVQHNAPALVDVGGLMSKLLPAQPVTAGESGGQKERIEESAAVAMLPGGALVAAARRTSDRDAKSLVSEAEEAIFSGTAADDVSCDVKERSAGAGSGERSGGAGAVPGGEDRAAAEAARPGAGGVCDSRPSSDSDGSSL